MAAEDKKGHEEQNATLKRARQTPGRNSPSSSPKLVSKSSRRAPSAKESRAESAKLSRTKPSKPTHGRPTKAASTASLTSAETTPRSSKPLKAKEQITKSTSLPQTPSSSATLPAKPSSAPAKSDNNRSTASNRRSQPHPSARRRAFLKSPGHLNKSTPALSGSPRKEASGISPSKGQNGGVIENMLSDSLNQLAPKAKFRSDGEISICELASSPAPAGSGHVGGSTTRPPPPIMRNKGGFSPASPHSLPAPARTTTTSTTGNAEPVDGESHIYESIEAPAPSSALGHGRQQPVRPPRATVAKSIANASPAAAAVPQNASSSLPSCPGTSAKAGSPRSPAMARRGRGVSTSARKQQDRLSSDVQCWPWAAGACVNSTPSASKSGGARGGAATASALSSAPPSAAGGQRAKPGASVACGQRPPTGGIRRSHRIATKSASLDDRAARLSKGASRSVGLLQRLGGLRRSFSRSTRPEVQVKSKATSPGSSVTSPRTQDPDWVFFRGFSGKRREDLIEPFAVQHGPLLAVANEEANVSPRPPPRRRRPRRDAPEDAKKPNTPPNVSPLRRTLSFTDAHFIAQAVYEGDRALIEELYPDFPRSTPIYAAVDFNKKTKKRNRQSHPAATLSSSSDRPHAPSSGQRRRPAASTLHSSARDTPSRLTPIPAVDSVGEESPPAGSTLPTSSTAHFSESPLRRDGEGKSTPSNSTPSTSFAKCPNEERGRGGSKSVGVSVDTALLRASATAAVASATPPKEGARATVESGATVVNERRRGEGALAHGRKQHVSGESHRHRPRLLPISPADDGVTFSSPVMFVKQASDLHRRIGECERDTFQPRPAGEVVNWSEG